MSYIITNNTDNLNLANVNFAVCNNVNGHLILIAAFMHYTDAFEFVNLVKFKYINMPVIKTITVGVA